MKSEKSNLRIGEDPVVEFYKKDIDRTLIRENLKLTPEQRCVKFENFMELVYELKRAGRAMRQKNE